MKPVRQFYAATNQDVQLKPYESWIDFAGHLKHEASIINFIAAYGTHPLIEAESTIEGKRAAAFAIVFGTPQIVSGPETTGVAWTGPEGVAWIGLATPASSIDENILVDDAYYNFQNPDVLAAGIDPDLHFALFGAAEGRRPNQFSNFDGARYLAENPDVAAAGMDPLIHFLAFGRFEGRLFYSVAIDENILVDDAYYNLQQSRRAGQRDRPGPALCAIRRGGGSQPEPVLRRRLLPRQQSRCDRQFARTLLDDRLAFGPEPVGQFRRRPLSGRKSGRGRGGYESAAALPRLWTLRRSAVLSGLGRRD